MLLEAGADVNAVGPGGRTPLQYATHAACAELLVNAGAESREGKTPIYTLASGIYKVRAEVLLRLAERGADLAKTGGHPGLVMRKVEKLRAERSRGQAG